MRLNLAYRLQAALLALLLLWAAPAAAQFADQAQWTATAAGTANAVTITIPNFPAVPPTGVPFRFKPSAPNTAATTLNISGSGVKNVFKPSPSGVIALGGGEFIANQPVEVLYDGTEYVILSSVNSTLTNVVAPPQGRITLTTGVPVLAATVTAATTAYYTPYVGNQIPIYNGSTMIQVSFSELSMAIPASRLANVIYDGCVFLNSGTPTFVMGPAWTTSTAGSGARGTGAGTPELTRVSGILVNNVSISAVNGASTFTVPANQCTYVGSFYMDGTNGQVSALLSIGASRRLGIWNAYNRVPIVLNVTDPTASWPYTTATTRQSNNAVGNTFAAFTGLAEEPVLITFEQNLLFTSPGGVASIGIGINATAAFTGTKGFIGVSGSGVQDQSTVAAKYTLPPSLGVNNINALENGGGASGMTFTGTEPSMLLSGNWRY